jgi:putative PEP-CTERM system TPR-repeat lipoprotein
VDAVFLTVTFPYLALVIAGCLAVATVPAPVLGADLQSARDYIAEGENSAAIVELKNVLQQDPDNGLARLLLGKAYLAAGDAAAALSQLGKAHELGIWGAEFDLLVARARLQLGQLEAVAEGFDKAAPIQSEIHRDLFVARAEALLRLGQIEEGQATLDRVLESAPHARALGLKSRIASQMGDLAGARVLLDEALRLDPDDELLVLQDAQQLFARKQFEEALQRFGDAIAIAPDQLAPYIGQIQSHLALGQLDDAGDIVGKLRAEQPRNPVIILQDALYQFFSGNFEKAKEKADSVLALAEDNPQALFTSGVSAYYLKKYEQARGRLSAYLLRNPQDDAARAVLGSVMLHLGFAEEAYETVMDADQIPTDNLAYLGVLSAAAFQTGDSRAGLEYLERLAEKKPDNAQIQERLAVARFSAGDVDGGIAAIETTIALDPGNLSAQKRLFAARLGKDDLDGALSIAESVEARFPDQAVGASLKAVVALRSGDRVAAKAAFAKALLIEPDDAEAGSILAAILFREGETEQARDVMDGVLEANPDHLRTLLRYAALEQQTGNQGKAEALMRQAVETHPDSAQPRILLARLLLRSGKPEKALEVVDPLLEDQGENLALLEVVGMARMRTADTEGAVEAFTDLAELAPNNANAHAHLMRARERNQDIEGALGAADQTLAIDPAHVAARQGRVRYLVQLGNLEAAKADLEALKIDYPRNGRLFVLDARIAMAEQRASDALSSMEQAHALTGSSLSLLELAKFQLAVGRRDEAMAMIEEWMAANPEDTVVRGGLAEFLIAFGRLEDARAEYESLLEGSPDNVRWLNNYAWVLTELGAFDEAVESARRAYNIDVGNASVADTLAVALLRSGEKDEALVLLREAVRKMPDRPDIRFHFATALSESGDTEGAIEELERSLRDGGNFRERPMAEAALNKLRQ